MIQMLGAGISDGAQEGVHWSRGTIMVGMIPKFMFCSLFVLSHILVWSFMWFG